MWKNDGLYSGIRVTVLRKSLTRCLLLRVPLYEVLMDDGSHVSSER